jgi:hypothetical protein
METPQTPPQDPTPEPQPQEPDPRPVQELGLEALVDRVNARTEGNRHDYLTRGDVAQVVEATLAELGARGVVVLER